MCKGADTDFNLTLRMLRKIITLLISGGIVFVVDYVSYNFLSALVNFVIVVG